MRVMAKVSDMGLCCSIKQHMSRNGPRTVRAMSHVAPELQRCGRAGPESDVYSFGILMWEVFTAQAAYRKLLDAGHLYEVRVCHLSKECTPLSSLLYNCPSLVLMVCLHQHVDAVGLAICHMKKLVRRANQTQNLASAPTGCLA